MLEALRRRLGRLAETTVRFPAAAVFIAAAAILSALSVSGVTGLDRYILTCAVGAAAGAAAQTAFERFFTGVKRRIALVAAGVVLTLLFFLVVRRAPEQSAEMWIRSAVATFALMTAFVWFPVIRSGYRFGENFMASFKAVFQAGFFTGVIFLGCAAVLLAIDRLIVRVPDDAYSYVADAAFVLIAPLLYLSLMPAYPGRGVLGPEAIPDEDVRRNIEKRTGCPKFLEIVLSDILVPLVAIFTVVLIVYILLNIGGKFWTDNLLEPLLISYSVVVIAMTLLVSGLENRFAMLFRVIFPKLLIPIAAFQTLASLLLMAETGVTHTRYFVVLFGLFAIISGTILSTVPMRRSGAIAATLIILSVLSVVPPTDAFTISRFSQTRSLELVLRHNSMLSGGKLLPSDRVSDADRTKITSAVRYLGEMDWLRRLPWLPAGFSAYDDTQFYTAFGFHQYAEAGPQYTYVSLHNDLAGFIPITGYDACAMLNIPVFEKTPGQQRSLTLGGESYSLSVEGSPGAYSIVVKDGGGKTQLQFDMSVIFRQYAAYPATKATLTPEEAVFRQTGGKLALEVVVLNAGLNTAPDSTDQNASLLILLGTAK